MVSRFRIEENEEIGRYLVSTGNFQLGDIVWDESPLFYAPTLHADIMNDDVQTFGCVGCCVKVDKPEKTCPKCSWPCCSAKCSQSAKHMHECKTFSRLSRKPSKRNFLKLIYLRMYFCKRVDPKSFEKLLDLSHSYSDTDEDFMDNCDHDIMLAWNFLAKECQINISKEEVTRLWFLFRINNFKFSQGDSCSPGYAGVGVYYHTSLLSNGCSPNLEYSFVKSKDANGDINWNIRVFARKTIKPGDVFTIAYSFFELQFGTVARQVRIHANRRFYCLCPRCHDRTEGGTYFQAMICSNPKCAKGRKGRMLPMQPLEFTESPWMCDKCHRMEDAQIIEQTIKSMTRVPHSFLDKVPDDYSVVEAETFLEKQKKILYPSHYMMHLCTMHWLFGCKYLPKLMTSGQDAERLFKKILERANRCLVVCIDFMPCYYVSRLLMVMAKVNATYVFKSSNLKAIIDGDHPVHFKLKVCNRIVALLRKSLTWRKLKFSSNNAARLAMISPWSKRVVELNARMKKHEDLAVESVRHLFP